MEMQFLDVTADLYGKDVEVDVVRDTIRVESVETKLDERLSTCTSSCDKVAYLKLNQFGDGTVDEWEQKMAEISTLIDQIK
jgi:C-terminal processing protease CtpA/Prc